MTTFQQWGALRSRTGERSPQMFCRANTRHSWALWAFLIKGCSQINGDQVHCLCGHNLNLILPIFLSSFPCNRNKITFLWGLVYHSVSSKLSSCYLSQKDLGTDVLFLFAISEAACVQLSPPVPSFSAQFWTDQNSESLSYLSRAHRRTYFPLCMSKTRAPSTAMMIAIDKGFEDHEQILLFL